MKVFNITPALTAPAFKGVNETKETKHDAEKLNYPHISGSKLNAALKASLVVPVLASGLSACGDRIEAELGGEINPPVNEKFEFIHRFPAVTLNGVTFSEQTVNINKKLDTDSPVNKAFNNVLNTLSLPKKTDGAFPVNMFWAKGDSVFHMMMDGALTNDDKYVYHLSKVNRKEGKVKNFVINLTNDDGNLKITADDYLNTKEYNVICRGDSVIIENDSKKTAVYQKEIIPQANGKDKFTVKETVFEPDTTSTNLDNFVLWAVDNK